MAVDTSGDRISASINKQVHDILQISSQNEVIQSFVRGDACDSDEQTKKTVKSKENAEGKWNEGTDGNVITATVDYSQFDIANRLGKKKGGKWSRRQRLLEEVYTDKDRAAAVNLGTRDIKQSLKLKRKQDRSRILEISEEAHPGSLLALGKHELRNGDVDIAVTFINKALELNPYDKNALVYRSKCYLLLGHAELALQDAEQALKQDKTFIKGLYEKAEALYQLGKLEHSLMYFHRGLHIRPEMESFRLAVQKVQKAIENTIGKESCDFDANNKVRMSSKKEDRKLLKQLHLDKSYLQHLLKNTDLQEECVGNNKVIKEAVQQEVEYLERRKEFWRQQQCNNNNNNNNKNKRNKKQQQ